MLVSCYFPHILSLRFVILLHNVLAFSISLLCNFFFLSGFSFTDTGDSQNSRGTEETLFYSALPLVPAYEHSDIRLQLCMRDDHHIFSIALFVCTRQLLGEIYHLIELILG